MGVSFSGGWDKIGRYLQGKWKDKAKPEALKRVAAYYERQIKNNIITGGALTGKPFTPLVESTIRRKGSSKPLIDTGEMLNAIKAESIEDNTAFVGIRRGTTHGGGKEDTALIAATHEFGAIVTGGDVPARPFIQPVLNDEKILEEAYDIISKTFAEAEDAS